MTLARRTPLRQRTPMRRKRRGRRRESAWRSPQYLRWVSSLPCVMCGRAADDAHHLIGIGGQGGAGTKAPDYLTMPVCREHHNEIHRRPELWPEQPGWIRATLRRAEREGVIQVEPSWLEALP